MSIKALPLSVRMILFVLLSVALAGLLFFYRVNIGTALIPLLTSVVSLVENRYTINEFTIIQKKTEFVYFLQLVGSESHRLYGNTLPGMDVSATTLVTHSLQQIFLLVMALLSGLLFHSFYYLRLLVLMAISLLIAVALDIPFVLLGSIEGLFLDNFAPDQLDSNWLVRWQRFISNGGRMAICICLAVLALSLARKPTHSIPSS